MNSRPGSASWYGELASGGIYTQSDPIGLAGGINTYTYVGGNPISFVDPDGLKGASGGWGGQGRQPPGPMWDFVSASLTGPAFSFGATLTRNGTVFLNTGFGGVNPQPSVCVSVGILNQRNPDPATVDAFLSGWGSSLNYPTLGFGFGNVFSSGNPSSAQVINFGTPSFGGGNASYGTPIINIFGR